MGENGIRDDDDEKVEVNIYPLNSYYFGSKDAIPSKDHSLDDRLQRFKSKFVFTVIILFSCINSLSFKTELIFLFFILHVC